MTQMTTTTKTFYEIHYKDSKGTGWFMASTYDDLYSAEQRAEEFKKEHPEYTDITIIKVTLTRIETQVR